MRLGKEIRSRVELVGNERGIDETEIKAALASGQHLINFAHKHSLSMDWLLLGDLRGLERQTRWERALSNKI